MRIQQLNLKATEEVSSRFSSKSLFQTVVKRVILTITVKLVSLAIWTQIALMTQRSKMELVLKVFGSQTIHRVKVLVRTVTYQSLMESRLQTLVRVVHRIKVLMIINQVDLNFTIKIDLIVSIGVFLFNIFPENLYRVPRKSNLR